MTGTIPFRRVVLEIDSRATYLAESLELLSVSQQLGVIPRSTITDKEPRAEDLTNYKRCWPGDLVLNRMSAYQGALGLARQEGIVSPDYAVLRSGPAMEPRFLAYMMKSQWFVGEMTARLRGIGSPGTGSVRTPRVNVEDLGTIQLPLPPVEEQRRIADFLDDQVARIDELIETASGQQALVETRRQSAIAEAIPQPDSAAPLSALAIIIDTEHKTAPAIPDGGYWIVGTSAIRNGEIDFTKAYQTDQQGYAEWTRRGAPSPGDVLLTREAPVGEAALVPDSAEPMAIGQRVVLIKPGPDLDPKYLLGVLLSPLLDKLIRDENAGSLHPHLNMSSISRMRIPTLDMPSQALVASSVGDALASSGTVLDVLSTRIALLEERKRALITAAVTGEMDVTTARPIGMGKWVPGVGADVPPPAPTAAPSLGGI